MKKFLATYSFFPSIEEIEVERETDKFVFCKVGDSEVKVSKTSSYKNVRDSYEEAFDRLGEMFRAERDKAREDYALRYESLNNLGKKLEKLEY